MINIFTILTSTIISMGAFIYGVYKLFRKKRPLYFQLLICAVGCLALEQLYIAVAIWCNIFNPNLNLGMIGLFGCNNFLLSANYGQLDRIVDDGSRANAAARKIAFIAPVILVASLVAITLFIFKTSSKATVLLVVTLFPACIASYFNLKHLIMPMDDFGFLRATRNSNFVALVFYILSVIYVYGIVLGKTGVQSITIILMSISMLAISIFAVKGVKRWEI